MKMRLIILAAMSMVFLFTSCEKEALLDTVGSKAYLLGEDLTSGKTINRMVPIKGEAYISIDEYNEFGLGMSGKIQGKFSHLGKLNEVLSTWVNLNYDFEQYPYSIGYTNAINFCAASGDFLSGTFTATLDLVTGKSSGTLVFEDGTGRFSQVSGDIFAEGYADFDGSLLIGLYLNGEGEISYSR